MTDHEHLAASLAARYWLERPGRARVFTPGEAAPESGPAKILAPRPS